MFVTNFSLAGTIVKCPEVKVKQDPASHKVFGIL
jgi:hypothetical protein